MSKRLKVLAGVAGVALAASMLAAMPAGAAASKAATAKSAKDVGGLAALIKLAKAEKELNVIALPPDWANYGEMISTFSKKYKIKVNSMTPDASSADELAAVKALKGQKRQPDVVDVGVAFADQGANEGLWAPYKVATWNDISADAKEENGLWYYDYGGYIAIGYDAKRVAVAPKSFKDLLNPRYKGQVALNGNPAKANAAFSGVYASSIANGGGLQDITKGLDFWAQMKKVGNFIPVEATPATVQSGQTPITLDWDYLQAKYSKDSAGKVDWKLVVPSDAVFFGGYAQAVVKNSPHPAAARLWQEFLYSNEGQNIWLKGGARPIRLNAMVKKGTANKAAIKALPATPKGGKPIYPTLSDTVTAKELVATLWGTL
uniref:ABC transporter substrate-binding protein n=1 Tax=Candidatus Planktophila sp. TaxID=2175601 RepID=UPI00404A15A1